MHREAIMEDSITLDNYFTATKKQTLQLKRRRKQSETVKRERKNSTQLSIFSWLKQSHPNQKSLILTLDKELILKVFSYLRISELIGASQVCSHFLSCYHYLWNDKTFFCQLETDKFTSKELGKLIEKSTRLEHIRQLKHIYSGKNINLCRQKIKIKVGQGSPNTGGMLQVFSVTPKNNRPGSTFILDSHISEIVNSSFRSLKTVELAKCSFLKQFECLSRCTQLIKLVITYNDNFRNEDLGMICKRCKNLQFIELQQCRRLDENMFQHVQYVQLLQSFTLKHFRQSFMKLRKLQNNADLTHLNIDGSLINDIQGYQILKLKSLTHLSIKNCQSLTNSFIDHLSFYVKETSLQEISIQGNNFDDEKVNHLKNLLQK